MKSRLAGSALALTTLVILREHPIRDDSSESLKQQCDVSSFMHSRVSFAAQDRHDIVDANRCTSFSTLHISSCAVSALTDTTSRCCNAAHLSNMAYGHVSRLAQ